MGNVFGIVRLTGSVEAGSSGTMSGSFDIETMGSVNTRRSLHRRHYDRMLVGDFCHCAQGGGYPLAFWFPALVTAGVVETDPASTVTINHFKWSQFVSGRRLRFHFAYNRPASPDGDVILRAYFSDNDSLLGGAAATVTTGDKGLVHKVTDFIALPADDKSVLFTSQSTAGVISLAGLTIVMEIE